MRVSSLAKLLHRTASLTLPRSLCTTTSLFHLLPQTPSFTVTVWAPPFPEHVQMPHRLPGASGKGAKGYLRIVPLRRLRLSSDFQNRL